MNNHFSVGGSTPYGNSSNLEREVAQDSAKAKFAQDQKGKIRLSPKSERERRKAERQGNYFQQPAGVDSSHFHPDGQQSFPSKPVVVRRNGDVVGDQTTQSQFATTFGQQNPPRRRNGDNA